MFGAGEVRFKITNDIKQLIVLILYSIATIYLIETDSNNKRLWATFHGLPIFKVHLVVLLWIHSYMYTTDFRLFHDLLRMIIHGLGVPKKSMKIEPT